MTFYVLPHKDLGYKSFKRERLIANDFLQIRKVMEHVYEKVICGPGSEAGSSGGSPTEQRTGKAPWNVSACTGRGVKRGKLIGIVLKLDTTRLALL